MPSSSSFSLVFVHGAGSNRDFWHDQNTAFPDAHFPNLPGHTAARDSTRGEGKQSIDEYADWLTRYVAIAGLQHVVLVGHSMGSAITLTLALSHVPWLSAIVLVGAGGRLSVSHELVDLLKNSYPEAVDFIMAHSFAPLQDPPEYKQKLKRAGVKRQLLRTPQAVTLGDYLACDDFDVTRQAGDLKLPTLCITGAEDRMVPPIYTEHLHALIKGSQIEIVPGAGHMLPLEKPAEFNAALLNFLSTLT